MVELLPPAVDREYGVKVADYPSILNNLNVSFCKATVDYSGALTFNLPPSTGQCISRFTNRKVPYCVKFNPDEDKQNLFVAGMSDKKIVQVMLAFAAL